MQHHFSQTRSMIYTLESVRKIVYKNRTFQLLTESRSHWHWNITFPYKHDWFIQRDTVKKTHIQRLSFMVTPLSFCYLWFVTEWRWQFNWRTVSMIYTFLRLEIPKCVFFPRKRFKWCVWCAVLNIDTETPYSKTDILVPLLHHSYKVVATFPGSSVIIFTQFGKEPQSTPAVLMLHSWEQGQKQWGKMTVEQFEIIDQSL